MHESEKLSWKPLWHFSNHFFIRATFEQPFALILLLLWSALWVMHQRCSKIYLLTRFTNSFFFDIVKHKRKISTWEIKARAAKARKISTLCHPLRRDEVSKLERDFSLVALSIWTCCEKKHSNVGNEKFSARSKFAGLLVLKWTLKTLT